MIHSIEFSGLFLSENEIRSNRIQLIIKTSNLIKSETRNWIVYLPIQGLIKTWSWNLLKEYNAEIDLIKANIKCILYVWYMLFTILKSIVVFNVKESALTCAYWCRLILAPIQISVSAPPMNNPALFSLTG